MQLRARFITLCTYVCVNVCGYGCVFIVGSRGKEFRRYIEKGKSRKPDTTKRDVNRARPLFCIKIDASDMYVIRETR